MKIDNDVGKGKNANYRKVNDSCDNSSTYHKKDSVYKSLRAKFKEALKKFLKDNVV